MVQAIVLDQTGGPDALQWQSVTIADPGPGEVRLRHAAIGLNYIDVYHRSGLYPLTDLPAIIGMEGAGDVIAVGSDVTDVKVGDRVGYAGSLGAYAEERLIPAANIIKLPDAVSYEVAAACMLQAMTVRYLFRETYVVTADTTMLFHAAAGGVGLIACQWARALGARMIGTVGSEDKAKLARANGCADVINTKTESFVDRVRELTDGQGCDVVYDSIGKDTFPLSLDCLKPKGVWVSFGNASGPVPAFDLSLLKGSLFASRPSLMAYTAKREDLVANAEDVFAMLVSGKINIAINQRYPLRDAADAHRALEARATTGSTVLTV
ncbi:MAG: quinone oxidoreductase [Alphaproteobacteria bacterium]|nr:quinone oxidoreductase [Alphaproteobacteria bacterium]